jgi:hypothetical protein
VSHRATQHDFIGMFDAEAIVGIIKHNFHKGIDRRVAGSFVQQCLAFFLYKKKREKRVL